MTPEKKENIQRMNQCKRWMQETSNGVAYDYGLAGPDGAWFVLFREAHHTNADIEEAKKCLYKERDVVRIQIQRVY